MGKRLEVARAEGSKGGVCDYERVPRRRPFVVLEHFCILTGVVVSQMYSWDGIA